MAEKTFDRGGYRPPRGYTKTHPPFEPNNEIALKHGAFSETKIAPVAKQVVTQAIETVAWLEAPEYGAALNAWARAEARCELLSVYLDQHGLLDDEGHPRPATKLMLSLERHAAECRGRLGLDPIARAKLEQAMSTTARNAVDVQAELARARELRLQAEARQNAQEPPGDVNAQEDGQ